MQLCAQLIEKSRVLHRENRSNHDRNLPLWAPARPTGSSDSGAEKACLLVVGDIAAGERCRWICFADADTHDVDCFSDLSVDQNKRSRQLSVIVIRLGQDPRDTAKWKLFLQLIARRE